MINPAVFTTTFLAAAVEIIEMVIIVVGVGAIRGWRSTLLGTGAGLAVVAALILALGTALTFVPINVLRLVAGSLLFVFGLQWLRKGIRRVAANGLRGMGARNATDDDIPAHGVDWIAFLLAFRGVVLEGLEVAIIVATFGAAAGAFPSAAFAAAAALVIIGGAGALARRLVERIPRSALQLVVGILLSAFGSFWATEGLGIAWPGADLFIIALAAWYVLAAAWYIRRLRRQTRRASQFAPQHARRTMIVSWLNRAGTVSLRGLVAFGKFWYGFVIGDDWTVAAAVAAALVVTRLLHTAGVAAWWLPPLVAVAATGASLRRFSG